MKKIIFIITFIVLISFSAYAEIDSGKAENQIDRIEQRLGQLLKKYNATQNEVDGLKSKDKFLEKKITVLSDRNEELSLNIKGLNKLTKENRNSVTNFIKQLTVQKDKLKNNISILFNKNEELSSLVDRLNSLLQENSNAVASLNRQLNDQKQEFKKSISGLSNKHEALSSRIDSLDHLTEENSNKVTNLDKQLIEQKKELSGKISETKKAAKKSVSELDEVLTRNIIYMIITVLGIGLFSIFAFIFLQKKVKNNQSFTSENLAKTHRELAQEGMRLDEKLVGIMETQLQLIQRERDIKSESNNEEDHSFVLKVADEIVRIEKNISQMDEETKGLKQLSKAIERIKDNFVSNGYEMIDMIGKPFDEGMKVTANIMPDENLAPGQRVISRIIKPQVNYKGEMIQSAQVEVSQGE